MKNTLIRDLYKNKENYSDKEIIVSGWVRTLRDSKTFGFIEINDGSFFKNLQIVFNDTLENFKEIFRLYRCSRKVMKVKGESPDTSKIREDFWGVQMLKKSSESQRWKHW